jgi:hypothetical protein
MPDLQIGIHVDGSMAARAAAQVAAGLAGVVTTAKQAGDAQDAASQHAVQGFARARDASGKFVAGVKQAADATKAHAGATAELAQGFGAAGGMADLLTGALTGVAAQFTFVGLAQQGITALAQAFQDMKQSVVDATGKLAEQREQLAELAALKGLLGMSTEAMRQDLAFRAETLQTAPEARSFQETALGAGQISIDTAFRRGNITQEEFDKLMIQAGKFQAVEHGEATTHGELAGMIPMLMGGRVTAEQAFQKEAQLYTIAQPGRASFSSIVGQFLKNSSLTSAGIFKDMADQMALTSMFTLSSREGAGEEVQQFTRATVGSLGRMRGMPGMKDIEGAEKQAEYLKRIGAKPAMDPIAIGKLIADDMEEQRKVQGEKFNSIMYLQSKGYGAQEDRNALIDFATRYKSGQWKGFEDLARTPGDARGVMEKLEGAAAADPRMRHRRVEIMEAMADAQIGAGAPEAYQDLMRGTFAMMKGNKEIGGDWKDIAAPNPLNAVGQFQHMRVVERARQLLMAEAKRSGVTDREISEAMKGGKTDEEQFSNVMNVIGRHRGREVPGLEEQARIVDGILRVASKDEDAVRAAHMEAKPALPVGPAAGKPARPP